MLTEKLQSRAPKIIGDFGEGLVSYTLIRKGYEVANVDHVGADLIAEKEKSRIACGVKTRNFSKDSKESLNFVATFTDIEKLKFFADQFGMKPVFAWVFALESENTIHLLMASVESIEAHLPKVKHGYSFRFSQRARGELLDREFIDYSSWTGEQIGTHDFD